MVKTIIEIPAKKYADKCLGKMDVSKKPECDTVLDAVTTVNSMNGIHLLGLRLSESVSKNGTNIFLLKYIIIHYNLYVTACLYNNTSKV